MPRSAARVRVRYAETDKMQVAYYEVQRPADQVVTAVGRTVHAAVNRQGRPTRLPAQIREVLA